MVFLLFSLAIFFLQICDQALRINFQNKLNHYHGDYDELDHIDVKPNDICGVVNESNHFRCEVLEIVPIGNDLSYKVYLIDYGFTISVKKSQLFNLKFEDATVEPFCFECQLSVLNNDAENFDDIMKRDLLQKLQQISDYNGRVLVYFQRLAPGTWDTYDVILLSDDHTENTYLLHESYAGLNYKLIQFDNATCEEWFDMLINKPHLLESDSQFGEKKLIEISHIVSPSEMYVRDEKGTKRMTDIRQGINSHVRSVRTRINSNWSIGDSCLVLHQNPLVESKMLMWYRGRILVEIGAASIVKSYEVFMCDYGYKLQVKESDLMPIPDDLANLQDCVTFCCLDILYISTIKLDAGISLLHEFINYYKKLAVSYSDYTAAVVLWGSNSPGKIEFGAEWDDLNWKIMSRLMKESMQYYIDKSQHQYNAKKYGVVDADDEHFQECQMLMSCLRSDESTLQNPVQVGAKPKSNVSIQNITRWDLPRPLDQANVSGIVTYLHETGTIFVQLGQNHVTAKTLDTSIANYIADNQRSVKNHVWKKGSTCFAKLPQSNIYRRAIIKRIEQEKGICQVETKLFNAALILLCLLKGSYFPFISGDVRRLW